jgi:hypothetical protein
MKVIVLSEGLRVPIPQYVKAIKTAKANPGMTFKRGLTGWWPVTGADIVRQFVEGMVMDHCNRGIKTGEMTDGKLVRAYRKHNIRQKCFECGCDMGQANPFSDRATCPDCQKAMR